MYKRDDSFLVIILRNGLVDYSRLFAAFGIVWFHSGAPGHQASYISLPFFAVLISLSGGADLITRARRLLLPFLTWSVIYGLVEAMFALRYGRPLLGWWRPDMIVTGTVIHLWFLPFAFMFALISILIRSKVLALIMPIAVAFAIAAVGTLDISPFAQYAFGIIPSLIGLAHLRAGKISILSLMCSYSILAYMRPSPDNFTILAGSSLALAAMSYRVKASAVSALFARWSLRVYLGHVLVLIAGQTINLGGIPLAVFGILGSLLFAASIEIGLMSARYRRLGRVQDAAAVSN